MDQTNGGGQEGELNHQVSINSIGGGNKKYNQNISMSHIQVDNLKNNQTHTNASPQKLSPNKNIFLNETESKNRLAQVKDVLKNSQTLKEQLKGVCLCYDNYVSI